MLHLGKRLSAMHETRRMFSLGLLSEQIVGVLVDAWAEPITDVFARDELMLVDWAKRLPYLEAKLVIDTWVAHADPDRVERNGADSFESRRLHLSKILDGEVRVRPPRLPRRHEAPSTEGERHHPVRDARRAIWASPARRPLPHP